MSKEQFNIVCSSEVRSVMACAYHRACELADDGEAIRVTVETRRRRSVEQNAAMWALLADIADQVNWYGQKLAAAEWKDVLMASLKRQKAVPGIDGGFVVVGGRTSELSVKEMSELIELAHAFAAQQGVRVSAPKWMERGGDATSKKKIDRGVTIDGESRRVA